MLFLLLRTPVPALLLLGFSHFRPLLDIYPLADLIMRLTLTMYNVPSRVWGGGCPKEHGVHRPTLPCFHPDPWVYSCTQKHLFL